MPKVSSTTYKQYNIKKNLYKSYLEEQKHHKKEILKEEAKLKKQKAQNEKYKTLPEYDWLRKNPLLLEEQMDMEKSISSVVSYYKYRLAKLPDEIAYEKKEMERLKKSILADDPKFDFNSLSEQTEMPPKKQLQFRLEKLATFEHLFKENSSHLDQLKRSLDKIQSKSQKTKAEQTKERSIIEDISDTSSIISGLNRSITGCKMIIADIVKDMDKSKKK